MANYVTVATIAPSLPQRPYTTDTPALVEHMQEFWRTALEEVLPAQPDIIVLPEACDRFDNFSTSQRLQYITDRGNKMLSFFQDLAEKHGTYIVYSAARALPDGSYRNSSQLIDRRGNVVGTYNKNHLVVTEISQSHMLCGGEAPVLTTDFGTVAMAICFDLNFEELLAQYRAARPAMILFSSRYHGGFHQQYWAYECRSYFVGSCHNLPCEILNPVGTIVAASTNYYPYTVKRINLDYAVVHLDFNWDKLRALRHRYKNQVSVFDPGFVGAVLVESHQPALSAMDMLAEFEIETVDSYFADTRSQWKTKVE